LQGAKPLVDVDNREVVTALREIAAGKVTSNFEEEGSGRV
jgi:DNA-directed RNA polymerase subunit K/omega